jgi:hypothetical protein
MEKPQMISIAGLKARGWTQALITLLGEPDVVTRNSHYAKLAPMRLYDTARVASFEVSSEFLAAKAKAARRQCGAKTAVQTKRAALMQQVLEMQVSVETRPEHWVRRATIEAYNERHWDGDGAAEDAPAEFLERITVNFIRHNLTAYDRALEEVAGRVGIASAVQAIRAKIYSAIGESYPALADECSRQLMRRGL